MAGEPGELPPAGWYPDPEGHPQRKRYWDGAQWTDRYEGAEGPSRAERIDRGFGSLYRIATVFNVLGWLVAILGTVGVIVGAIVAGGQETTTDVFGNVRETDEGANAVGILIFGGLGVFLYSLFFFAASAFIHLMLRVEDSTFRTAAAIERFAARERGT